jgi:hypothetical protein
MPPLKLPTSLTKIKRVIARWIAPHIMKDGGCSLIFLQRWLTQISSRWQLNHHLLLTHHIVPPIREPIQINLVYLKFRQTKRWSWWQESSLTMYTYIYMLYACIHTFIPTYHSNNINDDMPTPKHKRQLTTCQVSCQVERIFYSLESNRQPLPWDLGISPSSSNSSRSSRTIHPSLLIRENKHDIVFID